MSIRPNESTIRQRVWQLVEPVCVDAGYELVDVRFVTEQSGWLLRVLIDVPPGATGERSSPGALATSADADTIDADEDTVDEVADTADADESDDDANETDAGESDDAAAEADADADDDDREAPAAAIGSLAAASRQGANDGDIDLADCERISREISAVLDVDDPISLAYSLEVSSPGIDRPLVTEVHFRRYVGAEIKATLHRGVLTAQGSERKNFRGLLIGVEGAGKDAQAKVMVDGQAWLLPIADVDHCRIVPDWDAVMKGGRGQIRTTEPASAGLPRPAHPHKPGAHGRLPHPKAQAKATAEGESRNQANDPRKGPPQARTTSRKRADKRAP